jgi:type III restriction enzyme
MELSKGGRLAAARPRRRGTEHLETEGQMLQRVMPDLMGMKNILAINDEAHHCYREKPTRGRSDDEELKGDEKKEAEKNNEAARLWISGLEAVNRKLGLARVFDLSATPFFLRGSGYAEGTLFPWTMSDFSLMDAIECGIVKLPRVPVADNIPGDEMPMFRNLWEHIRKTCRRRAGQGRRTRSAQACRRSFRPRWKRSTATTRRPTSCGRSGASGPALLHRRLQQHRRSRSWSTTTSPASSAPTTDGTSQLENGRLPLFRNFDEHGNPLPAPTPC